MQRPPIPTYRLYGENSEDSVDFWLHCETLPSRSRLHNWEIATHRHAALFQLFHVTGGRGEMFAANRWQAFAGPCVLFVPPGVAHGFRFIPGIDGTVVTALADRLESLAAGDRAVAAFAAQPRIVPLDGSVETATFTDAIARIASEIGRRTTGRNMMLEALVTMAVVSLVRAQDVADPAADGVPKRDRRRFEQLETLVGAHYREHRPTAFYAERIGVTTTHLNRIVRGLAGASVQDMLANRLVEQARRDLVFTPTSVQAIAFSLGFSDPAYFNRFFRKRTGATPGRFRASRLAGES